MRRYISVMFVLVLVTFSCTKDKMPTLSELDNRLRTLVANASPTNTLSYYVLPDDTDYDAIPQDPKNPLTEEKIQLGRMMFFDTGLGEDAFKASGIGTYSCASCHIPEAGFRPNNFQGIADGGNGFGNNGENRVLNTEYDETEVDVQSARPLSLVNVAYVTNTFWNGQFGSAGINTGTESVWNQLPETEHNFKGYQGIETQNFEGLATHRITINKEILDRFGYTPLFDSVFYDFPEEERYTLDVASLAFSAYIRSILSNQAPFQQWLKGNEDALNYELKQGALLFFGKANCSNCHYRPNLGSLEFHALGVKDMYQTPSYNAKSSDRRNLGRGGFTLKEEDNYKFKVPGLYNIGKVNYFFHGASAFDLEDVIDYKIAAKTENVNIPQSLLSEKFLPLSLSETEKDYLIKFLEIGLEDPNIDRHAPEYVLSGNCFPNNDYESRHDLGCE